MANLNVSDTVNDKGAAKGVWQQLTLNFELWASGSRAENGA